MSKGVAQEPRRADVCCGDIYRHDAVRLVLGEVWHPGGLGLTGKLAFHLGIQPGDSVLDVACGVGTSVRLIAEKFGCGVIGIDHSPQNISEASQRVSGSGYSVEFAVGDSSRIPLADDSVDAVIMECVLSSFADKATAIRQVARVLKPGGSLGVTDVVVDGKMPHELNIPFLYPLCISGACSTAGYQELFSHSGLENILQENQRDEAIEFIESIRKKVFVARLLVGIGKLSLSAEELEEAKHLLSVAKRSVEDHTLGYALFVARKPGKDDDGR